MSAPREPDAELLESWHAYQRLFREWRGDADPEQEAIDLAMDKLEVALFGTAAQTPAGLAVKLRIIFAGMAVDDPVSQEVVIFSDGLPPIVASDDGLASLWRVIRELERMGRLGAQP